MNQFRFYGAAQCLNTLNLMLPCSIHALMSTSRACLASTWCHQPSFGVFFDDVRDFGLHALHGLRGLLPTRGAGFLAFMAFTTAFITNLDELVLGMPCICLSEKKHKRTPFAWWLIG